nr:UDP-N-acetylmuramoyl-L-alanyl-D-glutamate--2,6-diaminopimelate ligase [Pseudothauera nasutitermitis]
MILAELTRLGVAPTGITADSRRVTPGEVFAAWPGFRADGRRHVADAVARGAAAVLWDDGDGAQLPDPGVPALAVGGLRALAGPIASELFGRPSERLWMAGVTGTNGKTTVSQWLAQAMGALGERCGIIGTLGCGFPGELADSPNTTPDAIEIQRLLAGFLHAGASAAAMEVSSIGLDQGRVNGVHFDVAMFTNLSRDHLDYHGTMEAYGATKTRLFDWPGLGCAVVNLDDVYGLGLARQLVARGLPVIAYTRVATNADAVPGARVLIGEGLQAASGGLRFALEWNGRAHDLQVRMVAPFNVSNLLAVAGALLGRGLPVDEVVGAVARLTPPEGRMQLVGGVAEPLVVIDYAHTPDALAKVLEAVRATAESRGGKVVCVFGCGGDRDAGKRPLMGEVAERLADRVVITSDNPRGEDPQRIIDEIAEAAGPRAEHEADRARAIGMAVADAGADDVVVVAGKGHEPYQEIQGRRLPFSDLEQARLALRAWNRKHQEPGAC